MPECYVPTRLSPPTSDKDLVPKRSDIHTILLIGSGPIVIGQACEFDYSGTQACKALREEGYRVILVNSNPATIMTDPGFADRTYIEPLTPEALAAIIERERPDALLPTMGGQTALNLAVALGAAGVLERFGVRLIGASLRSIEVAEDRDLFRKTMASIGLDLPRSVVVSSSAEALRLVEEVGYPVILRPSFTLGGSGGAIAYNRAELEEQLAFGLRQSPRGTVLVEQSVLGWKEFELEVMRDRNDNVVVICSIENLDPMGVHTGDSITVAPQQTLTDREYQRMRDAAISVIRAVGVDTGGSNIQFAVDPTTGRMVVIEMNPRVSRSSALASKATGFPIAKMAAKLAVGYTLDEIPNDITKKTPACFEPTIDYVVVKIPRFAFEKFRGSDARLTTQMKSVGEVMSIGRTFRESLQKAVRSLEIDRYGFESSLPAEPGESDLDELRRRLHVPTPSRLWDVADAFRAGLDAQAIHEESGIDPWFLRQIGDLVDAEGEIARGGLGALDASALRAAKELGFSDRRLADLCAVTEAEIRDRRQALGVTPAFKAVDTCGAEFEASTPYLYSTYDAESEAPPTPKRKIVILGGGPNRIGQGIEFDYCCVHASFALKEDGFETVMVNCNPETVSTDYDTSDRLYFEPLTFEDVLAVIEREKPEGVIVQFGGQTPLKLAVPLEKAGVRILGTPPDAIDRAEDRGRFGDLLRKLGLLQPEHGTARTIDEAREVAKRIGYPVLVRPSYVLGGRAMEIVPDAESLQEFVAEAAKVSPAHPVLIDRFLRDAIEVDVDALCDGREVVIAGIMEHVEEAGVHSGDSACALPAFSLAPEVLADIDAATRALALDLGVVGLMNVQFAVKSGKVYVLEVNPRASRTVPFVSKATGVPVAKIAARVMAGARLESLGVREVPRPAQVAVKESVFPFLKFPGADTILGPEMRSTGEVMGLDRDFFRAFAKAQLAAGNVLPRKGRVFLSVRDEDKGAIVDVARRLSALGFKLIATRGTREVLRRAGIECEHTNKVKEGQPHIVDKIISGEISMVINTTSGRQSIRDSYSIRRQTLQAGIPYFTNFSAAQAATGALEALTTGPLTYRALQEYRG
jgi:carbamoyl-phosphate synthase large subunit